MSDGGSDEASVLVDITAHVERSARMRGRGRRTNLPARPPAKTQAQRSRDYRERLKRRLEELEQIAAAAAASHEAPLDGEVLPPERNITPQVAPHSSRDATQDATAPRLWRIKLFACLQPSVLVLFLLFLLCGAGGFAQEVLYLWSLGLTFTSGMLLAVAAVVANMFALFGLVWMANLWRYRKRLQAIALVPVYVVMLIFSASNAVGFIETNVGDTLAGRQQAKDQRAALDVTLKRKRAERDKIVPHQVVSEARVAGVKAQVTLQCPSNKIGTPCIRLMNKVDQLGQERDLTARAQALDNDIRDLEGKLTLLPAIKSADPLVDGLRRVGIPESLIELVRTGVMALFTLLGGFCLALVKSLWEGRVAVAMGRGL